MLAIPDNYRLILPADEIESRVQEMTRRAGMINEYLSRRRHLQPAGAAPSLPRWHMIGHVQRNKVRALLPWVDVIHSLDTLRLAEEIDQRAGAMGRVARALMQVNASGEKSKFGAAVGAAVHLAEQIVTLPNLQIIGLMTMAPPTDDPETVRPVFVRLRELFEEMRYARRLGPQFVHLSMGMSQDFEVAIEEGATMVRIGTALFDGVG